MKLATSFVLATLLAPAAAAAERKPIDFNRDVRPILSENCFHCHGPDVKTRKAELRLDLPESAGAVIEAGDPGSSELFLRIHSTDPEVRMPPPGSRKTLSAQQRALLTRWIREGGSFQTHWSFAPIRVPSLPDVQDQGWAINPIDRFVLARLNERAWRASPEASRETLIRRVTLDLTGLPPSPAEIDAFLKDASPDAYEKLVQRLLRSPRRGEQMAADWLEAARYADTDGYQNDRYRYMHVWRDWVIEAFNSNMPYDEFVVEQLAGDMLPNPTLRQQIATGFCRNHRINSEDGSIPGEWHVENVVDRVDTLGTVFLGLTIGCARCHDHKYDPISQKDYYRLFAFFNNAPEWGVGPNNGNSPPFIEVPESWPHLSADEDRRILPDPVKLRRARKEAGNGLKRPQAGGPTTLMVMHELPEPRATYRLERGQYNSPDKSERLSPGVPAALNRSGMSPRNRLELARWLTHQDHPLTARVAVNRLWQQFFGAGLVATSENFGSQGEPPSHPQLLDWLAGELIRGEWDLRDLQRLIVTSRTYRQSSRGRPELDSVDPENRLLARGPRFRMHAFVLRDQALAAAGLLVEEQGGRSVKPYMPPKIWQAISNNRYVQDHGKSLYRRSLYTYWRRTIPPPTMLNFNAADREVCSVRKDRTNTPLQALTLMNNTTFVEAARLFAERMLDEGGSQIAEQLAWGFRCVTGREPRPREQEVLVQAYEVFLEKYGDRPEQASKLLAVGEHPSKLLTVGEHSTENRLESARHAAMTMCASMLFNLDEVITRQ